MPKPVWVGSLTFGRVAIPINLYPATSQEALGFRLLHVKDHAPIELRRFCSVEGIPVPLEDVARGYEYTKGRYVLMSDEDLARSRARGSLAVALRDFVDAAAIDWIYFDGGYYVAPGRQGERGYALLRTILAGTGRAGIGSIVMWQKEHLAAIKVTNGILMLATLRFPHEVRSADEIPVSSAQVDRRELELAQRLVDAMTVRWDPARYKDTHRELLLAAIRRKLAGEEIAAPVTPEPSPTQELVKALEESIRALPVAVPRKPRKPMQGRRRRKEPAA